MQNPKLGQVWESYPFTVIIIILQTDLKKRSAAAFGFCSTGLDKKNSVALFICLTKTEKQTERQL